MSSKLYVGELKDSGKAFLAKILRLIIFAFLILLCIVIIKGILKKDELVFQPISSTRYFQESGFSGPFIARKLQEEISKIYQTARTVREDEVIFNIDQSKDINMNLMGLGVSASNIIYHLRDLLGIQTNYISGNITDIENTLSLSLHINNPKQSKNINIQYTDGNRLQAFDSLLYEGAKFITSVHNPYRLAVYYKGNNNADDALQIIRQMAQNKEDKKWAYNLWGNIVKDDGGFEKSLEYYQIALDDDPEFALAYQNMAWTHFNMNEYEKAITCFKKAHKLRSSNNFATLNGLALSYERMGEIEIAKDYFKENIKLSPDHIWTYRNYTEFLSRQKDTVELASVFSKARSQSFAGPMYYMMMGGYYFYQNRVDSSSYFFKKAIDLEPNNIDALTALFDIQARAAHLSSNDSLKHSAIKTGRDLIPAIADSDYEENMILSSMNRLAILEYQTGQIDSSLARINEAIEKAPQAGILYSTKAEAYAMRGDYVQFFEIIEIAFQRGFIFKDEYFENEPYDKFKNNERFMNMIEKYSVKETDLKN